MLTHFIANRFSKRLFFNGICCLFMSSLAPTASDAASLTRISGSGVVGDIFFDAGGAVDVGDPLQFSLLFDEDQIGRDANSLPAGSRHQIDDAAFTLNVGEAEFLSTALIDIFLAVETQQISISNVTLNGNFDPVVFDSFLLFVNNDASLFADDSLVDGLQVLEGAEASEITGSLIINSGGSTSTTEQQAYVGDVSINVERNVSAVPIPATGILFVGALGMLWRFSQRR